MEQNPGQIGFDYDENPDRFRAKVCAVERYGLAGDVHEEVAERLVAEGLDPASDTVLDMGCGEGRFVTPARDSGLPVVALDYSATLLAAVADPRVQAEISSVKSRLNGGMRRWFTCRMSQRCCSTSGDGN